MASAEDISGLYTTNEDYGDTEIATVSVESYPGTSILVFVILTTVYFLLRLLNLPKELKIDGKEENQFNYILVILYVCSLIISNYGLNLDTSTKICGITQWNTIFVITFVPWLLIFGIVSVLLIIFPGWKVPFANTFGYLAVKIGGLKTLFNNDFINSNIQSNPGELEKAGMSVGRAIQYIYGNESLLINEIPFQEGTDSKGQPISREENLENFIKTMQSVMIFKENISPESKSKLYKLLLVKDLVSEYIWYLLVGILIASVSYNYIINVSCQYSSQKMKDRYDTTFSTT